jgi:hypothetical protein
MKRQHFTDEVGATVMVRSCVWQISGIHISFMKVHPAALQLKRAHSYMHSFYALHAKKV